MNGVEEERDEMSDEERETRLVKKIWQRQIGECEQDPGTNRHKGRERNTKPRTNRSETGAHTA